LLVVSLCLLITTLHRVQALALAPNLPLLIPAGALGVLLPMADKHLQA
jgi:hypothetical protein